MKALFIGYTKCGTKTMNVVFKTLGYKVYDAPEHLHYHAKEWTRIMKDGSTVEDFKQMYAEIDACVDTPVFQYWEEILEAFPDTKLVVAYRDEETWIKSLQDQMDNVRNRTILKFLVMLSSTAHSMHLVNRLYQFQFIGANRNTWPWESCTGINYTLMRHRYRQHNLYIQEKAPKDQLHVVDFKQGWEPICKFLGEPVPDVPFPHENKAAKLMDQYLKEDPIFLTMKRELLFNANIICRMKALFIGYSKCGTKTMNVVFKTLGYKVYDAHENFYYYSKEWNKILKHGCTAEDFKRMYKNVDACVDVPTFPFWEEILEAFPDTKLLVVFRDEDKWMESCKNQMRAVQENKIAQALTMLSPTARKVIDGVRLFGYQLWGANINSWPWEICSGVNYTLHRYRYRQHNLYIREKAPKDQLHVVDFNQGWQPICRFLGEPVPNVPFPHENKAAEVLDKWMKEDPIFLQMKREAIFTICVIILLLSIGVYFIFH